MSGVDMKHKDVKARQPGSLKTGKRTICFPICKDDTPLDHYGTLVRVSPTNTIAYRSPPGKSLLSSRMADPDKIRELDTKAYPATPHRDR